MGSSIEFGKVSGLLLYYLPILSGIGPKTGVMVGEIKGELVTTPLEDTWKKKKEIDTWLLDLVEELSI